MADYKLERAVRAAKEVSEEDFPELLDKVTDVARDVRPKDAYVHISNLKDELAKAMLAQWEFQGISTGYKSLDSRMGGLEAGSVVLVAGKTSAGKSALVTNIAVNVAKEHPVLFITLEMTTTQMLGRLSNLVVDPSSLDIMFQRSYGITYRDLEPLVKKAKEERDVKLVVLDYLQYLGRDMRMEEVARMSKTIKELALKYDTCFLVIASLRKGEAKVPWTDIGTDDLMGMAAIAYDADTIVLASRKDPQNEYQQDKFYVRVLKTRNKEYRYDDKDVELLWHKTKIYEEGV